MAYIEQISEKEASGELGQIYEVAQKRAGGVANILKVMSLDAATLKTSMQFYINRIADGLGVDPEEWMTLDPDTWLDRKAKASDFLSGAR